MGGGVGLANPQQMRRGGSGNRHHHFGAFIKENGTVLLHLTKKISPRNLGQKNESVILVPMSWIRNKSMNNKLSIFVYKHRPV